MKKFGFSLLWIVLCASFSYADLYVEVLNFETREVRMIYEVEDELAGNKEFRFPGAGFLHDKSMGPIEVESVFDVLNNFELEYSLHQVGDPPSPQLHIKYQSPIKKGDRKVIRVSVIVNLPPEHLYQDSMGRYVFEYETSHELEYAIPPAQYLVYVNQPVTVYEREKQVFVKQSSSKSRRIKIMTRLME